MHAEVGSNNGLYGLGEIGLLLNHICLQEMSNTRTAESYSMHPVNHHVKLPPYPVNLPYSLPLS